MKFLRKNKKSHKLILVISDLHLGAGDEVNGKKNPLEDFHADRELVDFFQYFSKGEYLNKEVELIINGDFLDFLAVPFVPYFDDEFWSEKAALEKLELILKAHPEVMKALDDFLSTKNKKLTYIIGNHDAELVFDSLKERFLEELSESNRTKVTISNELNTYEPTAGVFLQHGHEYESLHDFDAQNSIIKSSRGDNYFLPPWGSYYVTHVINKYKQERVHVNEVRPIRTFLIHGLIFDTFFILRFMIANVYFYMMIRFLHYYRLKVGWGKILEDAISELSLFQDFEGLTRDFFDKHQDARVLIVGHTHQPVHSEFKDGTRFINTGTWTRMVNLDLSQQQHEMSLTFAKIDILEKTYSIEDFDKSVTVDLLKWAPKTDLPYEPCF